MTAAVQAIPPAARLEGRTAAATAALAAAAAGLAVLAVPFVAFTGLVLHQFYVKGSFLEDAGWFAYVMSTGDPRLPNPLSIGGGSFFTTHIAPLLVPLGVLKQQLPLADPQFFAGVIGGAHALPALGVLWALWAGFGLRRGVGLAGAVLVSIAFAFNGTALAIARYPHVEILIVGSVILFAVALVRRRCAVAALFLGIALATREDAGFHVFGLLFVLICVNRWYGIPLAAQRAEVAFAVIALLYSAAAVALGAALATGPSAFMRIYIGDPPFAKATLATVAGRLLGCMAFRTYLVLPALVAAMWAAQTRNPYILVGYVGFVPWTLLQLIATSDIAGTLSGYYGYPFMVAAFWPLVGVLLDRRRRAAAGAAAASDAAIGSALPILAFAAMIAASFAALGQQYNPGRLDLAAAFLAPPASPRQAMTDRAVAALVASKPALGTLLVDGSVVALAPNGFTWGETVHGRAPDGGRPDTVAYFASGYEADAARRIAAANGLNRHYRVPRTSLRLATDRQIEAPAPLARLLAPDDPPD